MTNIGTIDGLRYELVSEHETTLPIFKAPAPDSDACFADLPDIPFLLFGRSIHCFEEKNKCKSI